MEKTLKFLFYVIVVILMLPIEVNSKKREEVITADRGYGYELASPAASMVIRYGSVREEFIYEEGQTTPSMRIVRKFNKKGFCDDTLSYDRGKIVRVGKFRNYEVKKRVELFDEGNLYIVGPTLPGSTIYDKEKELRLSDFDSHGNWTKAYYRSNGNKPVLTRTISYELSPEQKVMLSMNKNTLVQDRALAKMKKVFGIILVVLCAIMCILAFFIKNVWKGTLRWLIWLICGIPVATFAYHYGDYILGKQSPNWIYHFGALVLYMVIMRAAIMRMSRDRRIANKFILTINLIWSIWAVYFICPMVMGFIMPNFFGRILRWMLGVMLFVINENYVLRRCPVCHNPHGLEFDHRSHEGYQTENTTSTSYHRRNPNVVGFSQSGGFFSAKVRTDTTSTSTITSDTYELFRDHYVCYECGHVESTSKQKGALIARNISRFKEKYDEIHNVNGRIE